MTFFAWLEVVLAMLVLIGHGHTASGLISQTTLVVFNFILIVVAVCDVLGLLERVQ